MKTIVTNRTDIAASVKKFKRLIVGLSTSSKKREWVFPNGNRGTFITYSISTNLGELLVAIPQKWDSRQPHLFALRHEGSALSPDVEINIPDSLDRRVSGAYVKHDKQTLICHRGGFTAYRGKIPREISLTYFAKWLVTVEDAGRQSNLISVVSFESSSLANDIAEFVSAVSALKAQFKAEQLVDKKADQPVTQVEVPSKNDWRDAEEYEGKKSSGKSSGPKDYEYLHGPLCNALRRSLKKLVSDHTKFEIFSNKNIDVAIVDAETRKAVAIFEVKTSTSLSSQLYSAYGQLSYYKYEYGSSDTPLILVLPEEAREEMAYVGFFKSVGVDIIYGSNEKFVSSEGVDLSEIVKKCVRA